MTDTPSQREAWTAGPWCCDDFDVVFEGARFGEVAYVLSKEREPFEATTANARLIAAAPDLYAAGEALAKVADDKMATVSETLEAVRVMRAALSRARGEVL